MNALETATSEELIQELMQRATFAGVIIYSSEQQREDDQYHDDFTMISGATAEDTAVLLTKAAEVVQQGME